VPAVPLSSSPIARRHIGVDRPAAKAINSGKNKAAIVNTFRGHDRFMSAGFHRAAEQKGRPRPYLQIQPQAFANPIDLEKTKKDAKNAGKPCTKG
jgi:hypothetical protein